MEYFQGLLVVEGGGEKKGIEGIVVGIVGMEGMFGSEVAGNGGKVTFGAVGKLGMFGRGGRVGLSKDGLVVGSVGCGRDGMVGNGGTLPNVGIGGKGGNLGKLGAAGLVACRRLRAAMPMLMPEKEITMVKAKMKDL
ncbi:hypothetical protein L6164_032631 [Bauhinia variegata]|uniref:Uncharacterized protein n=1 Tax=Bauhinia variegata TaxID=167791 RepID=A0ACB9KQ42_BAUVA|nr:hypothetical protein L6164_032631 [Bauhinia variegata]